MGNDIMKIVTWNVNSIRACINKGFFNYFNSVDAGIFCLQETKLKANQLYLTLTDYEQYWSYADKAGYSGTAIFTKKTPIGVYEGMNDDIHNHEGRLISMDLGDFFLVNVYTPNSQNELRRLPYRLEWEKDFLEHIKMLEEIKPVIICGDLNVAHNPIDLARPESNMFSAGFTMEERTCLQNILDNGFVDSFRYLYPDVRDAYSYWSYMFNSRATNKGWRLDYFLVSDKLKDRIVDVKIRKDILGSDHCPVELYIKI